MAKHRGSRNHRSRDRDRLNNCPIDCPNAKASIAAAAATFASVITGEMIMGGAISRELIRTGCPDCIDFFIFNVCAMQLGLLKRVEHRYPEISNAIDEEFERILEEAESKYEKIR